MFEHADGGLAALEYNADKPTSQREIWAAAEAWRGGANPSRAARQAFGRALARTWAEHRVSVAARAGIPQQQTPIRPRVAILTDPSHREEHHLAYLFGSEIARLGWQWEVAGPDNLVVEEGWPVAYGRRVHIVLRQYPAEYLHELPAIEALWECAGAGRLLWLNDPRSILSQAKSSLAILWECVEAGRWLTAAETRLVRRHVPPTGLASAPDWLERAAARREDWVLKPVLGRFSEGVSVGALASAEEWEAALTRARASPDAWVVQAYVPPRRRWLPAPGGARGGYVNWGVYLAAGRPAGILARLQPSPLTAEATAWWGPVRLARARPAPPRLLRPPVALPRGRGWPGAGRAWEDIAERATLAGYTNVWTDGLANFTLGAIGLRAADWDLVSDATLALAAAIGRALSHMEGAPGLSGALGIAPALAVEASRGRGPAPWSFLSRFDWARTRDGRWKLLEINSDTPAGLWEAGIVAGEVSRLHRGPAPAAGAFWPALAAQWGRAVEDRLGRDGSARIGLIGAVGIPEDLDQLLAHARAIRLGAPWASVEIGAIGDVTARDGRAWLHGEPVDLLFRYHPLDWFPEDQALMALLELSAAGRLPMLPPAHALLPQSKAFLALLWELCNQGFFPAAEAAAVRAYVPLTVLDPSRLGRRPYVVKPYLEREGHGVRFSSDLGARERRHVAAAEVVYQERLDLQRLRVPVATARGWRDEERALVFGVFLAGDRVAGVYTRAGAAITGREAVFVPVVLE